MTSKIPWDAYYMNIAYAVSLRSSCVKRQVGSLITADNRIVSTGYNGTPRGMANCNEGGCKRCNSDAKSGEKLDQCWCNHAEENAITQAAFHGISIKKGTLYTTLSPCVTCAKMIVNAGIHKVVFAAEYPEDSKELLEQTIELVRLERPKLETTKLDAMFDRLWDDAYRDVSDYEQTRFNIKNAVVSVLNDSGFKPNKDGTWESPHLRDHEDIHGIFP